MKSRAIDQLRKLVKIEGVTRKDGTEAREQALEDWLNNWIEEVSISQSIIKKNLTKEDQAVIGEHLREKLIEEIMDNCVKLEQTPNRIQMEALALRR